MNANKYLKFFFGMLALLILAACAGAAQSGFSMNPHYGKGDCPDAASANVREAMDPKLYPEEHFRPLPFQIWNECFTLEGKENNLVVKYSKSGNVISEFEYKDRFVLKDQVAGVNISNALFEVCVELDWIDYDGSAQCFTILFSQHNFWAYDPPALEVLIDEAVAPEPTPQPPEPKVCRLGSNIPIGIVFSENEWDRNWEETDRWEADCIFVEVIGETLEIFRKDSGKLIARLLNHRENNTLEVQRAWEPDSSKDFNNLGSDLSRILTPGGSWGKVRIVEVYVYEDSVSNMYSGTGFPFKHDGNSWLVPGPGE